VVVLQPGCVQFTVFCYIGNLEHSHKVPARLSKIGGFLHLSLIRVWGIPAKALSGSGGQGPEVRTPCLSPREVTPQELAFGLPWDLSGYGGSLLTSSQGRKYAKIASALLVTLCHGESGSHSVPFPFKEVCCIQVIFMVDRGRRW
jgi:hypothetical protein